MQIKGLVSTWHTVTIDPIEVIEEIRIDNIEKRNWVIKNGEKYYEMKEVSAGQHSFDIEVREISQEIYEICEARDKIINYLREQKTKELLTKKQN